MNNFFLLFAFFPMIFTLDFEPCVVRDDVMDCSSRLLEDCPTVNTSISELIMDNNKVKDLRSGNCSTWSQLRVLRVSYNQLEQVVDFDVFYNLTTINVSHNILERVHLSGEMIETVDISYNRIVNVTVDGVDSLQVLILAHNSVSSYTLSSLLKDNLLPMLDTIDLSYNELHSIPISFMNFSQSYLSYINLSGNKITSVYFKLFTYKSHKFVSLDLSFNIISSLNLSTSPSIKFLDLSHNQLIFLNDTSMPLLLSVETMDFSYNPFNCSCKLFPIFVTWMKENGDRFMNWRTTNCSLSKGPNIFDPICDFSLLAKNWLVPLTVFIIMVIIVFGIILILGCQRLTRKNYISRVKRQDVEGRNTHLQTDSTESFLSPHLDFEDNLIILCTSRDTKWVSEDIAANLQIKKEVIDYTVHQLPFSESILIVINGDASLKDSKFIKNVKLALDLNGTAEIRLVVRNAPGSDILKSNNIVVDYVNKSLNDASYMKYEDEFPPTCVNSIKAWLNIEMYSNLAS